METEGAIQHFGITGGAIQHFGMLYSIQGMLHRQNQYVIWHTLYNIWKMCNISSSGFG